MATKRQVYLRISTFWIRIFAVAFGMGMVSGIVLFYQLGRYSDALRTSSDRLWPTKP
ncbi:MAG: cytochrome ubiquinol oxidase subunit I [Chromatiales bacterium]